MLFCAVIINQVHTVPIVFQNSVKQDSRSSTQCEFKNSVHSVLGQYLPEEEGENGS
jgi:hypothetical protein